MLEIYDHVLSQSEIAQLLDWFNQRDNSGGNDLFVGKQIDWQQETLQKNLIKKVLDTVLDKEYEVDSATFLASRDSFRLHADSGENDGRVPYKTVLIPLYFEGNASTVMFDNYWHGKHAVFRQQTLLSFSQTDAYQPHDSENLEHKEITDYKDIMDYQPDDSENLEYDEITDYKDIINYQPDAKFDPVIHSQYLNHNPIENLHGLSLDTVIPWVLGQAFTWDRSQLHCAGSGHSYKVGITVFTYLK
jgi:hypothetical protein